MREAVIVSMARTPIGKYAGGLSSINAAELGGIAIKEAVKRAGIDPMLIDDVIFGNIGASGMSAAGNGVTVVVEHIIFNVHKRTVHPNTVTETKFLAMVNIAVMHSGVFYGIGNFADTDADGVKATNFHVVKFTMTV